MKYEAVEANSSIFEVKKMCLVLGLKAPNYYRLKRQREKRQHKREQELIYTKRIEDIFLKSDKIYGYRMIAKELEKSGQTMSEHRIRRIMKEKGFYPETRKKYKPTHNTKTDGKYCENIVKQNFKAGKKNEIWVGDITYIKTTIGWVYLAIVIDSFNREVIGYSIGKKIDSELVKRALVNAIARNGTRENMIFHSDRGCQYASKGYYEVLENNGIKGSMSRPGCPYDNSCAENFFATLKKECIYRKNYTTIEDVKRDMFRYIELFYNRKRMHSVLGYLSPIEYRLKYDVEKVA